MNRKEHVLSSPSREMIILFWKWVAIVLSVFLVAYFFANQFAAESTERYHMYYDWELNIPLIPWMIIIYLSYVAVFLLLPLVLKVEQAMVSLAYSFLVGIIVSTVVFVLFPGELGYHRPEYVTGFDFLYQALYQLDKPHNLYPSLHVTFSTLTAFAMVHQTKARWFHLIVLSWAILIAVSVILVHQHHMFDIITGWILAISCFRFVYLRYVLG